MDFQEFLLFCDHFGGTDPLYDLDSSGKVDVTDFFLFADHFAEEAGHS